MIGARDQTPGSTMPARILVIEDDPASLELVTFLLEAAGYEFLIATDGASGLDLALRENPDLVLSDVQMPALTGYELAQRLRAESAWRRVPVVAVSAFSMRGDREKALAAGFDGYLTKPIAPLSFIPEINAFLPAELRRSVVKPGAS